MLMPRSAGAAGNFLASVDDLSVNAFKTIIDIDLIGSWITVKATIPYLVESAQRHRSDGKSSMFLLSTRLCLSVTFDLR